MVNEDSADIDLGLAYSGSDPAFSVTLDLTGTTGSVVLGPDGNTIIYTAAGHFDHLVQGATTTDSFLVAVTADGATNYLPYEVTIEGANDAPTAIGTISDASLRECDALSLTLDATPFEDLDGDTLGLDVMLADGSPLPSWLSFDAGTGSLSGTAPYGSVGQIDLKLVASDAFASAEVAFALQIGLGPDQALSAGEDDGAQLVPPAYLEGDATAVVTLDTTGTLGSVSYDAGTGALSYDPNGQFESLKAGEAGSDSFIVHVDHGGTVTDFTYTVSIGGANDAPTAIGTISDASVREGDALSLTLDATPFEDLDGDTLGLDVMLADGSPLPSWLSFDAGTGALSGTAPYGSVGQLDLKLVASDGFASAEVAFALQIGLGPDQALSAGEDDGAQLVPPAYLEGDASALVTLDTTGTLGSVSYDAGTGALSYDPNGQFESLKAGEAGSDSFIVHVDHGGTVTDFTYTVSVTGTNDAPTAVGTISDSDLREGDVVFLPLDAGLFTDLDGDALSLDVTLADGSALPAWLSYNVGTGQLEGMAPLGSQGDIALRLTARDGTASASIDFALHIGIAAMQTVTIGEDDTPTIVAPDYLEGDLAATVTVDSTGTIGSVTYDAGTGELRYGPNGQFEGLKAGETGSDSFIVHVDHGGGLVTSFTYDVTIDGANDAPVAVGTVADQAIRENEALSLVLDPALFSDLDGDALSLGVTLADGSPLPAWLSFDALTGTLGGTPPVGAVGDLTLRLTASDGTDTATIDFGLHVGLAEHQDLTTGEDSGSQLVAPAYLEGDAAATVTIDATGTHGTVSYDPGTGALTYNPNGQFESLKVGETATDSFVVHVDHGGGVITDFVYDVTVSGANDAPVTVGSVAGQSFREGDAVSIALSPALFFDKDGDALSLVVTKADGSALPAWLSYNSGTGFLEGIAPSGSQGNFALRVTASDGSASASLDFALHIGISALQSVSVNEDDGLKVIAPIYLEGDAGAVVTIDTTGTVGVVSYDPVSGALTYGPNDQFESLKVGEIGGDSFVVHVDHGGGNIVDFVYEMAVEGANDAPVPVGTVSTQFTHPGAAFSFTLPDNLFVDPDGDALTYTAYLGFDGALPDWISFDPATRTYSGTAPVDFVGDVDLKLQAVDPSGATGGVRFFLTVTDGPFIVNPVPEQHFLEDTPVFIQLSADTFYDSEGYPLTFSASMGNGDPLPSWLVFDPVALTLSGQPPANYQGQFNVLFTADDGIGSSSSKFPLIIDPVPDAPTGIAISTSTVKEFSTPGTIIGVLSAIDPDKGDSFHYKLINDAGGSVALVNDRLVVNSYLDSRVQNGVKQIVVQVTDSTGNTVNQSFSIKVLPSSSAELFTGITPTRTVWVAPGGVDNDTGGDAAHPFASIQYALDHATPGTAIMVKAGTYAESIKLNVSGTSTAPIWLVSADGVGMAEIKPPAGAEINAFDGQAISNFVLDGFKITGTDTIGTYGINLVSRNNGASASFETGWAGGLVNNIVIKNNIVTNWGVDGIHIANIFNGQIIGNTVSGAHEQGIDIITSERLLIANNYVDNVTKKAEWFGLDQRDYVGDAGISVKSGSNDVQILNNYVGVTQGYGIKIGAPTGIRFVPVQWGGDADGAQYVPYEANNVVVRGNTALLSGNGSIDINASTNVDIVQNRVTTIRIETYDRQINGAVYDGAEAYFPGGIHLNADNIRFIDNVYSGSVLHNFPAAVHYSDSGNVVYSAAATYDPADYAFALGTSYNFKQPYIDVKGTTASETVHGNMVSAVNEYINGRGGADIMMGGLGDDVYILDSNDDEVIEYADQGTDTIILRNAASYFVMPNLDVHNDAYIENVFIDRTSNTSVVGNKLDNIMVGGAGADSLYGGDGDDKIYGASGADSLSGGDGRDYISGGAGDDILAGNVGDDILEGGPGKDRLLGGADNDYLISFDADIRLNGGVGVDTVYLDRSTFSALQAINLDISYFGQGEALQTDSREEILPDGTRIQNVERIIISAGAGNDVIKGGYFDDEIAGGAGNDTLNGFDGADRLWGAAGTDTIYGGSGDDKIDGGADADHMFGEGGNDVITSMEADYILSGGAGTDTVVIDRTSQTLAFHLDFSQIELNPTEVFALDDGTLLTGFEILQFTGGDGNDVLYGGSQNDTISGTGGDDIIYGNAGTDRLTGGSGSDTIYGGIGPDIIVGGYQSDNLWGGSGNDTFKFVAGQVQGDIIFDFEGANKASGDKMEFTGYGVGASLTYSSATGLWTVHSADGTISESFQIVGVTVLSAAFDYTLA